MAAHRCFFMKTGLFKLFVKMIDDLPDAEILKAIELEQGMLEDSLIHKSTGETPEVDSLLSFCQFIDTAMNEDDFSPVKLPLEHMTFYRKVVERLIESGKMPYGIKEKFDFTFDPAGLKAAPSGKLMANRI